MYAVTRSCECKNNDKILRISCLDHADSPTARKTRYDASLCFLTRRVSQMLQDSCNTVVDLNAIARALNVPKRRLYDVTNVLEGISLTRKTSKNHIEWL